MHYFHLYLAAVLASPLVTGSPVELVARDTKYNCPMGGAMSLDNAMGVIHQAPPESNGNPNTGSGYPHEFYNAPDANGKRQIALTDWDSKCLDSDKQQKRLLEAPIFADQHLYDFQKKKPKEVPGPARVIYTADTDKYFCGIIAHIGENSSGPFETCPKA